MGAPDPGPLEPLAPDAFSVWWLVAGILLVLAAAALAVTPWLIRRAKARRAAAKSLPEPAPATRPRRDLTALAEIDRIERAWREKELTDRAAAQEIASTVKEFAGQEAATLTLLDLRLRGDLDELAEMVEAAYPVEFGVKGEGDVTELAARARLVVSRG
jgi:hypothetical protein